MSDLGIQDVTSLNAGILLAEVERFCRVSTGRILFMEYCWAFSVEFRFRLTLDLDEDHSHSVF